MKRLREKCMECGEPIPESNRVDSKFCDPSCKARYWRKKKEQGQTKAQGLGNVTPNPMQNQPRNNEPLEGLRGVIDNTYEEKKKDTDPKSYYTIQDCVSEDSPQETEEHKQARIKKEECEKMISRILADIRFCDDEIKKVSEMKDSTPSKRRNFNNMSFKGIDAQLVTELDWSNDFETTESEFDAWKQKRLVFLHECKAKLPAFLEAAEGKLKVANEAFTKIPRYKPQAKILQPTLIDILEGIKAKKMAQEQQMNNTETNQDSIQENKNGLGETKDTGKVSINDRILSSSDVLKINYKSITFQGRWKEFLGQPAAIFHTAVHGLPGGGKSTFCLQFSEYLAKNFGKVIYVCGEEGYSKTLQEKLLRNNVSSPNLYFHDAKNYDDIKQYVPANKFHFIVIDSLDTLRIDAVRLKELKTFYSRSAFITISQSRKDGKMKGDNEILHDADTVIAVHKGIATTSKNRFNPSDRTFEVFPSESKG